MRVPIHDLLHETIGLRASQIATFAARVVEVFRFIQDIVIHVIFP